MNFRICMFFTMITTLVLAGNLRGKDKVYHSPEAIEILEKSYAAITNYPPLLYKTEKVFPSMKFVTEFRQRDHEIDVLTSRYDLLDDKYEIIIESRAITNGSVMVHYDIMPDRDIGAYFTRNENKKTALLTSRSESAFLDGWSEFDNKHLSKVMMEADKLVLHDNMETVNGNKCFVIESSGPEGSHKVWIDTDHDYHICKTIITKKSTDIYGTKTVNELKQSSFKTVFQITKFSKINGTWFPVEGEENRTWGTTKKGGSEEYSNTHMTAKRYDIVFNPNFVEDAILIDFISFSIISNAYLSTYG